MTSGFAIRNNGEILVHTISPTKIGAIVNWLVVNGGIAIPNDCSDGIINQLFLMETDSIKKNFDENVDCVVVDIVSKEIAT